MNQLQLDAIHVYKAVVKSMVRGNKRSRLAQRAGERKQEIALLTYKRMNLVREASVKEADHLKKSKLARDLRVLNQKVEKLKAEDPSKDRKLFFLPDSGSLKQLFFSYSLNGKNVDHFRDAAAFLNNQREYNELLERYNPGSKLSQDELVKRTAGRVGLNVPF